MSVYGGAQQNQLVTEFDIQSQAELEDYQVQLADVDNPTQAQDNLVIGVDGAPLSHWNESVDFDTWAKMNISVSGKRGLLIHGNAGLSSGSNGADVFDNYSDGTDYTSWTNAVTNVDGELCFVWGGASAATLSVNVGVPHIMEMKFRNEAATNQNLYVVTGDGSGTTFPANRNTQQYKDAGVTTWKVGPIPPDTIYSSLALSTYYISRIDDIDSSNHNYFLYDNSRNQLGSSTAQGVVLGTEVDPVTGITIGSGSGTWNINTYIPWIYIRKYTEVEPTVTTSSPKNISTTLKVLGGAG